MLLNIVIDDELMQTAQQINPNDSQQDIIEIALRTWIRKQRLHQAQQRVQKYVKPTGSIVDELIQERRQAAENE